MRFLHKKAAYLLLPAYLLMLIAAFIPHHHHIAQYICIENTSVQTEAYRALLVDCINNDCCKHQQDDTPRNCTDDTCITRIIHLNADHAKQLRESNGFVEQDIPNVFVAYLYARYEEEHLPIKVSYKPPIIEETIIEQLASADCGLRAPPAIA